MNSDTLCWAVIPAAGSGKRMGSGLPKQYLKINNMTMLEHSVSSLLSDPRILGINVVVDLQQSLHADLPNLKDPRVSFVQGGAERSDSVLAGLTALLGVADKKDWVLVHDAARPCVKPDEISRLIDTVSDSGVGGILAQRITDTVKKANDDGLVNHTIERENLWRALTPQMFSLGLLQDALWSAKTENVPVTDEAAAMERMGHVVQLVSGLSTNVKVTLPSDFEFAESFLDYSQVNHASVSEFDE